MPWLDELFPPEDSLDLLERGSRKSRSELSIAVLRLPSVSNFSDLDPLEAESSVQLLWRRPGEPLGQPDAVILPGSKQTLRDLASLRSSGLAEALQAYVARGGQVFALCGGLQMLGQELHDPEGLEGDRSGDRAAGLGLLPLRTVFAGSKALRQRRSRALWPPGPGEPPLVEGFELHQGRSELMDQAGCAPWRRTDNSAGGRPQGPRAVWWRAPTCTASSRTAPGAGAG